jgi:hypothetical protein
MKTKKDKVDFILGIVYINATKDELMEIEESELDIIIDKIWEEIDKITTNYYKEHKVSCCDFIENPSEWE